MSYELIYKLRQSIISLYEYKLCIYTCIHNTQRHPLIKLHTHEFVHRRTVMLSLKEIKLKRTTALLC